MIRSWATRRTWLAGAGVSLAVGALWLRSPSVGLAALFLVIASVVLLRGLFLHLGMWGALFAVGLGVMELVVARTQLRLDGLVRDPGAAVRAMREEGVAGLQREVDRSSVELRAAAEDALDAPASDAARFAALGVLVRRFNTSSGEGGIVLYKDEVPVAWGGTHRISLDNLRDSLGVDFSAFYGAMYATAKRGTLRAVAMRLLHADAPADAVSGPLDARVARASGLAGFEVWPVPRDAPDWKVITVAGSPSFAVRPRAEVIGLSRQSVFEAGMLGGMAALSLALLALTALAWRRPASIAQRMVSLVAALGLIALVPLTALSNVARLFDPSVYFASLGGPYTASVAALAVASAVLLLGFFTVQRSGRRFMSRPAAVGAVVLVAGLGPFLLRDLSRGITPPAHGITTTLWLGWQVALFLAATATLLAGASAGRVALGRARGVGPSIAPLVAAVSALVAPVLWEAPGRWPGWYPIPWIVAMGALALTRRSRASVFSAALVAALGATTLVFGATARRRVELAESDVNRLSTPDSTAIQLLERFARSLEIRSPPVERQELLQRYVNSDLAAAGYPVELASWLPGATQPYAELNIAPFERPRDAERIAVEQARSRGRAVIRVDSAVYGLQLVLAAPHESEGVTTVVVAPRSLLLPNDPFMSLAGLATEPEPDPPYTVALTLLDAPSDLARTLRWQRKGTELHGDARGGTDARPGVVHVEVDLRGLDALVPRGALMVLLDLLLLTVVWTLAASADGGMGRWVRGRLRRFARSFRARLTITLFSFFVVPAVIFALWSYARLQTTDQQSRELLVRETLRGIEATGDPLALAYESSRLRTPLFLYSGGVLRATSDPLYERLAPLGRFLPPDVALRFLPQDEVDASARVLVGGVATLFGYRAVLGLGEGRGTVLGAPARLNEVQLDRQRRDLGILVLFSVALGAIAALWLSGAAAAELGRPIAALQQAALRIARGGREVAMPMAPAAEFVPVFSAFQHMDEDLAASRSALEAAQRRTEAVLRNVASGVIAADAAGRVVLANPSAERVIGRAFAPGVDVTSVSQPLGDRVADFLSSPEGEATFELEVRGRRYRGYLTRLERSAGVVITLDDVTDLVRAQRVLAWGEMARQVAHEIKNPLTPIRLGVQHLRRARADRRVDFDRIFEQNVDRILAEIDRLDEIARSFSRYGAAPADRPAGEPVDVASIVRDVVELERLGDSEVAWTAVAEPVTLAIARPDELREVLLNVFENARQAGAREVSARVEGTGEQVHIIVRDDGPGIPADVLPKIFDPHFSTRTSGSGLGLAISRGMVRAWGGDMGVESRPGSGAEVRITLAAAPTP